jgi:hypothetical protein
MRKEWPLRPADRGCRRTAEQRDELAAFELFELHSMPYEPRPIAEYRIGKRQSAGMPALSQPTGAGQAVGVRFGSWLCKNALPAALMPRGFG